MVFKLFRKPKMSSFRLSNLFGRIAVVKEEHSRNALPQIVVTLFGMVMEVKEEQERNAFFPIVVTLSEMMIVVKEEHSRNA